MVTRLYHGTNGRWLNNILRTGIEPRGNRAARDNWKHVEHRSNRKCVYLTDSYAPYFAHNACDPAREGEVAAVIEIAVDRLDPDALYPDEDFLEQVSRGQDGDDRSMSQRTLSYRRRQFEFRETISPDYPLWWQASVKYLGTCAHRGTIPVSAITRVVTYPYKANLRMALVWDATITLINQKVCGGWYRTLTAKLFAGEFTQSGDLPPVPAGTSVDNPAVLTIWEAHRTALPPIKGWKCDAL